MVPKPPGGIGAPKSAPRLPPLPKLKVKRPNKVEPNPCVGILSSVLGCWASSGYTAQGCAQIEQQLRACMDARKPGPGKKSSINYHLSRMYPSIVGPRKRD